MNDKKLKKMVVLTTGGTIAGWANDPMQPFQYQAAQLDAQTLIARSGVDTQHLEVENIAQIDSKDMSEQVWKQLLDRVAHHLQDPEVQGLVVTHGSDTVEETAFLLQSVLQPGKPVVLTCAMRAANATDSDGPQNIQDALWLAAQGPAWAGVWLVCAGDIHAASEVYKAHSHRLNAFASEAGPVARRVQAQFQQLRPAPSLLQPFALDVPWLLQQTWPRVEVVFNHAMASGRLVEALLQHDAPDGLLVVGTGNGTVSTSLKAALEVAASKGVMLAYASRCPQGGVVGQQSGQPLEFASHNWSQARVALMLRLLERARCVQLNRH